MIMIHIFFKFFLTDYSNSSAYFKALLDNYPECTLLATASYFSCFTSSLKCLVIIPPIKMNISIASSEIKLNVKLTGEWHNSSWGSAYCFSTTTTSQIHIDTEIKTTTRAAHLQKGETQDSCSTFLAAFSAINVHTSKLSIQLRSSDTAMSHV